MLASACSCRIFISCAFIVGDEQVQPAIVMRITKSVDGTAALFVCAASNPPLFLQIQIIATTIQETAHVGTHKSPGLKSSHRPHR